MIARAAKLLAIFFLALAALAIATPRLLHFAAVRQRVAAFAGAELNLQLDIDRIHWAWLPLPHLTLRDARLVNETAEALLPEVRLYPHWQALLRGRLAAGKILLVNPQLSVKKLERPGDAARLPLGPTRIIIERGALHVAAGLPIPGARPGEPMEISAITATFQIRPPLVEFDLHGTSSFSKRLGLQGRYDLSRDHYELDLNLQDLLLHKAVKSLAGGKLVPFDSVANLSGHIVGRGPDDLTATLTGWLPCFLVKHAGQEALFSCGFADLALQKKDGQLLIDLNKLELTEPGLVLTGRIERQIKAGVDQPSWRLALAAADVNLDQLRDRILFLWGEHELARTVSAIVLGGTVKEAGFRFAGTTADFTDFNAMTITADVTSAAIHVPEVDLELSRATGKIIIQDGKLRGEGLSADLGASRGRNCRLALDLTGRDDLFELDLDLDADLAMLPAVLPKLLDHAAFRQELSRFSKVAGRGTAHLHLGDRLTEIATDLHITALEATASYQRLAAPLTIKAGELRITPGQLQWQGLKAGLGPHRIHDSAGAVRWQEAAPYLQIDGLAADLNAKALYAELADNDLLPAKIAAALAAVEGQVMLTGAALKGPAAHPEEWEYRLDLQARDLDWTSPLLPAPVHTAKAVATISHNRVILSELAARTLDHPLAIKADLGHHLLADWQGRVEINGTIRQGLADWVKGKNWIPAYYFPRLPCTLKDFAISWNPRATAINGTVMAGAGDDQAPQARLDLELSADRLRIAKLDFRARAEKAHFALDLPYEQPAQMRLAWQGFLSAATLNALLAKNILLDGELAGDFKLDLAGRADAAVADGQLAASGLHWVWSPTREPLEIGALRLHGQKDGVRLEESHFTLAGESFAVRGQMAAAAGRLAANLDLESPELSRRTVARLVEIYQSHSPSDLNLTGNLAFNIERFFAGSKSPAGTYTCQPLQGIIELRPNGRLSVDLSGSKLCGLDLSGTWQAVDGAADGNFHMVTELPPLPLFQEVFTCLGIEQDLIEGPFDLDVKLTGKPGQWRHGTVALHSATGYIRRLTLLSKIFSVVNLTDLFTSRGLPNLTIHGFPYSQMDFNAHIKNNQLIIDQAVIRGEGLNLFGRGSMNLDDLETDFVILIAPFKTLDTIITKVPLLGRIVAGKDGSIITIPVGVKGPLPDPVIQILPADAVGEALLNLVKNTLMLPLNILIPILPKSEGPPSEPLLED